MKNITIIGAGLGGLSAGALLANDGYKVTILEQHNIVGGCATTFKRKGGFFCEVGLHEMDALYSDKIKSKIFKELNVYENIEFVKPDEFFHIKTPNIDFTMPHEIVQAKIKLIESYPLEKQAIEKYFTLIQTIYEKFELLSNLKWYDYALFPIKFAKVLRYNTKSVKDVFNGLFKDENLKIILNANMGYYHDSAKELNFLLHAIAQYSFFYGQGWFIKGGSQKLSDYLASFIVQNGGDVITQADVISIKKDFVEYKYKGKSKIQKFDKLISNISPMQTYAMANIEYKNTKPLSNSLLTLYIGFNKNLKTIYGKKPYSNFFFKDVNSLEDFDKYRDIKPNKRGFVFVDYSQIDSALTKDKEKSFGAICTSGYLKEWECLSDDAYKAKKEELKESYLAELEKYYPNIKEYVEYAEVATAKTMQRYLKTPNATAYGFAPNVGEFFKIPSVESKKIKNLYFVGQWVLGGGFSPAINSGKLAYDAIKKS